VVEDDEDLPEELAEDDELVVELFEAIPPPISWLILSASLIPPPAFFPESLKTNIYIEFNKIYILAFFPGSAALATVKMAQKKNRANKDG
jgi:hypothetical protein